MRLLALRKFEEKLIGELAKELERKVGGEILPKCWTLI
jgi:hypothetical protein